MTRPRIPRPKRSAEELRALISSQQRRHGPIAHLLRDYIRARAWQLKAEIKESKS